MEKNKPILGIYSEYFFLRKDIPLLLVELSKKYKIKFFVSNSAAERIKRILPLDIEVENIKLKNKKIFHKLFTFLFKLFGKLPQNRSSFELSQTRKILSRNSSSLTISLHLFLFKIKLLLPKFISFDLYSYFLKGQTENNLKNIEHFLIITPIFNTYFISDILKSCKKVYCYIYSWDHPYKFNQFPKNVKYLTWNKLGIEDLKQQHIFKNLEAKAVGSSQFIFIDKFKSVKYKYNFENFIIYSGFAGYKNLIRFELDIIKLISKYLEVYNPKVKFYVRPYPFDKEKIIEKYLEKKSNVFHINQLDNYAEDDYFQAKYKQLKNCLAFFHCGTTLGIEASLLDIPTYLVSLDLKKYNKNDKSYDKTLQTRSLQSHVIRYMIDPNPSCYLNKNSKLINVLKNLKKSNSSSMTDYLKKHFESFSLSELCERISNQIK